jgi:GNAT superfamily N-acetyltransferase
MIIRTMRETDLEFALECIRGEGWLSETEAVLRGFLQYDSAGCLIGEEQGRRVGMCTAISYGRCGFLGELIVVKEQRGRGFGRVLLERGIAYLHGRGCRSIYLDGDEPAVRLYERLGFRHVSKSLRFRIRVPPGTHPSVRPMVQEDFDRVSRLDRKAFGADRRFFLEYRMRLFPELCRTIVSGGMIVGFCMAQPGNGVTSVGPWLVGEDASVTPGQILQGLASEIGSMEMRFGALEVNSRAVATIRRLEGLSETTPSWRMVLGPDTGLGVSPHIYAIGSAAKG